MNKKRSFNLPSIILRSAYHHTQIMRFSSSPRGARAVECGDHDAAVLFDVHAVKREVLDDLPDDLASGPDNLQNISTQVGTR